MFSAIFGNLFSQQKVEAVEAEQQQQLEQSLAASKQSACAEVATQTAVAAKSNLRRSYSQVLCANLPRTKTDNDWVIVDPSEEADKMGASQRSKATSMSQDEATEDMEEEEEEVKTAPEVEEYDLMLRSFFDRAEQEGVAADEAVRQGAFICSVYNTEPVPAAQADQWLITPLPCLAHVSSTQLENSPLENLLIEQPGVFMHSTDVVMSASPLPRKLTMSYSSIVKSTAEKRKESEPTPVVVAPVAAIVEEPVITAVATVATPCESTVSSRTASPQMPRDSKKNSKKSKKNNGMAASPPTSRHSNNNKENAVRALLCSSDAKKGSGGQSPRRDCLLGNAKQMKRNNKSMLASSNSLKQRKYHTLQQPISFNNTNNNQF